MGLNNKQISDLLLKLKEIEIDIKEHPEKYTVALAYRKMKGIKTRSPNGEYKK